MMMEDLDEQDQINSALLSVAIDREPLGYSRLGTLSEVVGHEAAAGFFDSHLPAGIQHATPDAAAAYRRRIHAHSERPETV